MNVRIPRTRATSREGVNAAQALFDACGCVFQEVAQQNDFGKDAYVDLADENVLTHLCVAVQIKSGESYRLSTGDYFIPLEGHASNWRRSTVPVFGIVFDPADRLLRWIDLTAYLRNHPAVDSGSVPVSRHAVLDAVSLRGAFQLAVARYAEAGAGGVALNLLSESEAVQLDAVYDAWALGRGDARFLLILRRLLAELSREATRRAIWLLSHCGSHPDILWTSENWIPQHIERAVQLSFRWSAAEIAHMLSAIEVEEWGRGTLGQCLDVLLYEDPNARPALHNAVGVLLAADQATLAVRAATLALVRARDQTNELAALAAAYPTLMSHEWFADIAASIEEQGWLSLY